MGLRLSSCVNKLIAVLDEAGHKMHLPCFIQDPLCNLFDKSAGLTDSEINRVGSDGSPGDPMG